MGRPNTNCWAPRPSAVFNPPGAFAGHIEALRRILMLTVDPSQARVLLHADLPSVPGCYALVADPAALEELGLGAGTNPTVLYVGKSEDSVRSRVSRTHLLKDRTGSSTLRRSIGALLREDLDLHPQPRSSKRSLRDLTNYKFDPAGEARLTDWIGTNLRVVGIAVPDPAAKESKLIIRHCPPLNLTGWANPHATMIKSERRRCAELAREAR